MHRDVCPYHIKADYFLVRNNMGDIANLNEHIFPRVPILHGTDKLLR